MGTDSSMEELYAAIVVAQSGDHSRARVLFEEILPRIGNDAAKNCILAHYMADVQESVADELSWDLKSLHHLDLVAEDQIDVLGASLKTSGFYASIYLNIANCYDKISDSEQSLKYLHLAEESCGVLENNEYGEFVRKRIAILRTKIRGTSFASR